MARMSLTQPGGVTLHGSDAYLAACRWLESLHGVQRACTPPRVGKASVGRRQVASRTPCVGRVAAFGTGAWSHRRWSRRTVVAQQVRTSCPMVHNLSRVRNFRFAVIGAASRGAMSPRRSAVHHPYDRPSRQTIEGRGDERLYPASSQSGVAANRNFRPATPLRP